ncbi:unnamed protein product [Ostreobium quekettii]|uniref:Uncharacterized protein n=1 Tax=Ostreobium quekettii TaxID=121088 RepID=A0A8S1ITG0_9CHLO|nr:unnamed protein product [Ostreobium quekettii]
MGPTDMDVNTDATSMNELVREKLVGALRVRQLQRREEALVEELEAQRRNARASAEQMEREATERRELRSEVDALRRTGEGLQGRLEAAERERRRAESRLGEANAAVAEYRKKTEELVVEKSDLTARLAQRWETLAHQHRQASEQRTIVEADKLKHFAEERARQAESHIRDLSRSNAALKGQIEVLKLEKRRNEDLQVETADLKQQLLEKTANFDGLSRKVSEMQKELQAKEKLHLTQLSRVEMEVTKLREAGDKCMQQALEAEIQFKEKLRDQELE